MTELVQRLKWLALNNELVPSIYEEAADRIEKLEAALREIRQSTTLYGAQTKARKALEDKQ